ncbi:GDP-Man:Man(3)GlcNAc(2)-PP-Dol alpha-1,2-mannosyltransferase [Blastocladiella britannica]|nr:GDP-Man:Man(3)GlcNAc(2)-PP-Dol alpha-1,2-mannosyltransferase [Blastocladiella britannica]
MDVTLVLLVLAGILFAFWSLAAKIKGALTASRNTWLALLAEDRTPAVDQVLRATLIGFFHPYCNAGGGGERVLWCAVRAVQQRYPTVLCVIYTGDTDATGNEILARATARFGIELNASRIRFVFLRRRWLIQDTTYPRLTLIGQSVGSAIFVVEALIQCLPDIFCDTMGYAFTYPVVKLISGCPILTYTHYPSVSSDMIRAVDQSEGSFNNDAAIARSPLLRKSKQVYYQLFARLYGYCGRFADLIMVNSSWTRDHIVELWGIPSKTVLVYPPCDTKSFASLPLDQNRPRVAVSVAQFRPEKNHALQLEALHQLFTLYPQVRQNYPDFRLVMLGSCRGPEDGGRVEALRTQATRLGIADRVDFRLNVSYPELLAQLGNSMLALHTMTDEHFGIGIVEAMAAGLLVIAHDSAGPKLDIVTEYEGNVSGFLATTASEYAEAIYRALVMPPSDRLAIQQCARASVSRFTEDQFAAQFLEGFHRVISQPAAVIAAAAPIAAVPERN